MSIEPVLDSLDQLRQSAMPLTACRMLQNNVAQATRLQKKKHNEQAGRLRYDRVLIAVSMPCMIANGVGGHPGTATSTGITFDTRPQLA